MDFIHFFFIAAVLFVIGVGVVLNRTNIVVVLMSLELALLSVSLNFMIFSVCLGDLITTVVHSQEDSTNLDNSTIEPYKNRGLGKQ